MSIQALCEFGRGRGCSPEFLRAKLKDESALSQNGLEMQSGFCLLACSQIKTSVLFLALKCHKRTAKIDPWVPSKRAESDAACASWHSVISQSVASSQMSVVWMQIAAESRQADIVSSFRKASGDAWTLFISFPWRQIEEFWEHSLNAVTQVQMDQERGRKLVV